MESSGILSKIYLKVIHYESVIVPVNESYFYLIDFLSVLYNFAVSDEIKYEIYETFLMKNNLNVFILNGNSIEKEYSLKLLMQLCYDKRVLELLVNEKKDLVNFISDLAKNQTENKSLTRNANGLLFVINKGVTGTDGESDVTKIRQQQPIANEIETNQNKSNTTNDRHIMISYNSKSRPMCLSIKVFF
jgi:hypothetical protein